MQLLLAAIKDGVSYDIACKSAGIAPRTIYNWKTRADRGEERAIAFVQALEKAEADVERQAVRNMLKAGEKDMFWAANATYLQRRYPDRWGVRTDDGNTPKVVVQIGVKDSDVTVNVSSETLSPSLSEDFHRLSPSVDRDLVNITPLISSEQEAGVSALDQALAARDPAGDPTPAGEAPLRARVRGSGKGVLGGRKEKRP